MSQKLDNGGGTNYLYDSFGSIIEANFFGRCCVVFNYKTVAKKILLQIRESF